MVARMVDVGDVAAWVLDLMLTAGCEQYFGEPVTQLEHALQSASLAERDGASDALVVSALLHDVGRLLWLRGRADSAATPISEDRREVVGARALSRYYGRAVTEPIRLHIEAKRYLCATNIAYPRILARSSWLELEKRGGPMTAFEIAAFEQTPWARDAVRICRWDDGAVVPGQITRDLGHFRPLIERVAGTW